MKMDQLLLNIHPPSEKTLENFIIGDNVEAISTLKNFLDIKGLARTRLAKSIHDATPADMLKCGPEI